MGYIKDKKYGRETFTKSEDIGGITYLSATTRKTKARKRLETTTKVLAGTAVATGLVAGGLYFPAAAALVGKGLLGIGKGAGKLAARHPVKTLLGIGLVGTAGGRKLLTDIPKKIIKGGEVLGKVYGGEETGLTLGGALKTAGLVGAGAIAGKMVYDYATGKFKREKAVAPVPALPGTRDVGIGKVAPVGVGGGIPMIQAPGSVVGAPGQQISRPPIQNIIQIAVR